MRADKQETGKTVRIICISDTHELHRELDVPPGDILIHAGDFTFMSKRPSKIADFDRWLGELRHPTKIVIPGNHDSLVEAGTVTRLFNATLLINRGMESHGLKIWGSPLTSLYGGALARQVVWEMHILRSSGRNWFVSLNRLRWMAYLSYL